MWFRAFDKQTGLLRFMVIGSYLNGWSPMTETLEAAPARSVMCFICLDLSGYPAPVSGSLWPALIRPSVSFHQHLYGCLSLPRTFSWIQALGC